jgi:hypothetical protein
MVSGNFRGALYDRKRMSSFVSSIYLSMLKGRARDGQPIRPRSISARTHAITRMPTFKMSYLRTTYKDTEICNVACEFEDGTIC